MVWRLLFHVTQPPLNPLRRVTVYYLLLIPLATALILAVPELATLVSEGPEAAPGLGGDTDLFEPVGQAPAIMREPLLEAGRLLVSLAAALFLMVPVSWCYMGTRRRTGFDQSVVQTMLILPIAVAGIVTIVHDSIALAFSLAGIVAGVRFRNSLRDTADALYIFAAIGVGLACGIGAVPVATAVSVFFNFTILLLWRCDYGVCPYGGPKDGYSSGWMLETMGIEARDFPKVAAALEAEAKGSSKKKRKKKKKRLPLPDPDSGEGPVLVSGTADSEAGREPELVR